MRLLRVLLASSVVYAHSYSFVFVRSRNAVPLFYIISGFLIYYALVANS
jgi:peptidoglycan/LPS O-acetylase OafA/YrhL